MLRSVTLTLLVFVVAPPPRLVGVELLQRRARRRPSSRPAGLYVGGDFSEIGGKPRANIAALDETAGEATDWIPGADGPVHALLLSAARYLGGDGRPG
jgi:hypothetical protein